MMTSNYTLSAEDVMSNGCNVEQHCHTNYTDGKNSIEEMIVAAIQKNVKQIVFTEHIQRASVWVDSFIHQMTTLQKQYADHIDILYGFEAKLLNYAGEIDIETTLMRSVPIMVGAVHGYPCKDSTGEYVDEEQLSKVEARAYAFQSLEALLKNESVAIIAHPLGILERWCGPLDADSIDRAVAAIKQSGKVCEINTKYHRDPFVWLSSCRKHAVPITIGSDSHSVSDIGKAMNVINAKRSSL